MRSEYLAEASPDAALNLARMNLYGMPLAVVNTHSTFVDRRGARGMALHDPNQIQVGLSLQLVFGDFLDAVDQTSMRGAIEKGLGIGRTELQVGDDIRLTDQTGSRLKRVEGGNICL